MTRPKLFATGKNVAVNLNKETSSGSLFSMAVVPISNCTFLDGFQRVMSKPLYENMNMLITPEKLKDANYSVNVTRNMKKK